MCRPLADAGFRVVLIAPGSFEDSLVQMSPWNEQIRRAGRVKRFAIALWAALHDKADIFHFHDPELIPLGLLLKWLRPTTAVVYDVHEDYPAMMRVKYWIPKSLRPLVSRVAGWADAAACRYLDGIVTADPGVIKDFQKVADKKSMVYYNYPIPALFASSNARKADLVYVGGISDRAGTFVLLDALTILAEHGLRPTVRLAGYTDGDRGRAAIRDRIQFLGLTEQVELADRITYAQVPGWIQSGRIGLVTLQPIAKFLKNIPTKMFEYWACGLPVIASDLPPIRQFLQDGQNGLFFNPLSAKDLARVIGQLVESPSLCDVMGNNGQRQVHDNWNNDRQIAGLVSFYERICRRPVTQVVSSESISV